MSQYEELGGKVRYKHEVMRENSGGKKVMGHGSIRKKGRKEGMEHIMEYEGIMKK